MPKRILVVDDDQGNRDVIRLVLEQYGYQVDDAGNTTSLLDVVKGNAPDLVILDIMVGPLDGITMAYLLAQAKPELPVIIVSGAIRGDKDVGEMSVLLGELGVVRYLTKPFDIEDLYQAVHAAIGEA